MLNLRTVGLPFKTPGVARSEALYHCVGHQAMELRGKRRCLGTAIPRIAAGRHALRSQELDIRRSNSAKNFRPALLSIDIKR